MTAERKKYTGYKDDNGNNIFVGDELMSEWNYRVLVKELDGAYYGELLCEDSHSCKNIPYSLNSGNGYIKIIRK